MKTEWKNTRKGDIRCTGVSPYAGGELEWEIRKSRSGMNHQLFFKGGTVSLYSRPTIQECKDYAVEFVSKGVDSNNQIE